MYNAQTNPSHTHLLHNTTTLTYFTHTHTHTPSTHPQWILIQVRWFSLNHLNGHDPKGPNVHLRPILLSSDHLRGHPVWGAHHCGSFRLLWGDLGTEPKISWMREGRGGEGRGGEGRGGARGKRRKRKEIDGKEGRDCEQLISLAHALTFTPWQQYSHLVTQCTKKVCLPDRSCNQRLQF